MASSLNWDSGLGRVQFKKITKSKPENMNVLQNQCKIQQIQNIQSLDLDGQPFELGFLPRTDPIQKKQKQKHTDKFN